jgi:Mg-chelatase subunit ChlD
MAANRIVEKIGEEQGTATNMGDAIIGAHYVYSRFEELEGYGTNKPCMLVLLTDGYPNDGEAFKQAVDTYFLNNPNVVFYIVGLGNPDKKLMQDIATRCGGEYFEPEDMGSLLIWYSKRARDLVVKLKGGRK